MGKYLYNTSSQLRLALILRWGVLVPKIENRNLGRIAVRGGAVTLGGQAIKVLLQLAGLIILARLLDPADFGIVAMVTAVVGIADILRDLGLSSAAIQAKVISHQQKSNLFWINCSVGFLMAVLCVVGASILADFYKEPRVYPVVVAIASCFLANGIQTQFQAELARSLRFLTLSTTEILSMTAGLALAISLSLMNFGYWALVWQLVSQSIVLTTSRMVLARWRPSLPRRCGGMGGLVRYGWNLMLTQVLVYISSNIDSVIVGWRFGPQTLGLYNRAFQLLTLPLNQVFTPMTNVALPVLSRLQDDSSRFIEAIRRAQLTLGYAIVIAFSLAFALSEPLIRIAFGEQWVESIPIFRILVVAGSFQAISYVAYWIFLAKGHTGSHFRFSLISRSILIMSIIFGSVWGPLGIAAGYSVGIALGWVASLIWLNRLLGIATLPLFKGGIRILLVGVVIAASGYLTWESLANTHNALAIVSTMAASLLTLCILCLIKPIRDDVRSVAAARKLLSGMKSI
jgi:PST family polysaccharide transporter